MFVFQNEPTSIFAERREGRRKILHSTTTTAWRHRRRRRADAMGFHVDENSSSRAGTRRADGNDNVDVYEASRNTSLANATTTFTKRR